MRSQPNIEVVTGNLKMSQAKSKLGKLKLHHFVIQEPQRRLRQIIEVAT